jgi:protein-S-isoprenylcysteine O-methyltransferase Ste14
MKRRYLKTFSLTAAILLVIILARPTVLSLIVGVIIICIGESIRIWAAGHLVRNREVTTSGPYAYLRDPLYLGRLFLLIGFCIMSWGYSLILLPIGLWVFFLNYMPRKYRKEMIRLEKRFGEGYKRYSEYAKSLIPKLKPYPHAHKRAWSFNLFWYENREQYFLLAVIVVFFLIVLRIK